MKYWYSRRAASQKLPFGSHAVLKVCKRKESRKDPSAWTQSTSSVRPCSAPTSKFFPYCGLYISEVSSTDGRSCNQGLQWSGYSLARAVLFYCYLIVSIDFVVIGVILTRSAFSERRFRRLREVKRGRRSHLFLVLFFFIGWWVRKVWGHPSRF